MMVFLSLNFQALVYNPLLQGKMDRSLSALKKHLTGQSAISKKDIIKYSYYPKTKEEIVKACEICKALGVAFVKTSTGFNKGGATVEDVALMKKTVGNIGVKASGGIRDTQTALAMIEAGATRIGASAGIAIVTDVSGNTSSNY